MLAATQIKRTNYHNIWIIIWNMNILSNTIMRIDLHYTLTHKLLENTFNGNVIKMLLNITE